MDYSRPSSSPTSALLTTPLFAAHVGGPALSREIETEYLRAQAVAQTYALTSEDVHGLSAKFWHIFTDNILAFDPEIGAILCIQYNLAAGTIGPWAARRPELGPILKRILNFECLASYMLTEQAHGLDAVNLETTATMLSDGTFDLHTPHEGAAKYMPPSIPVAGIKMTRVAVVFARLMVEGEDRGVRPFLVPISSETEMCAGVSSQQLPERVGARAIGHALTTFDHVKLPAYACLGSTDTPPSKKAAFQAAIWRVPIGAILLSGGQLTCLAAGATILARYSQRRTIISHETGMPAPIISFRTQQLPIIHALAQHFVMKAFMTRGQSRMLDLFCDPKVDARIRIGIATAVKAAMVRHAQDSLSQLGERSSAQGLYSYNQIIAMRLDIHGAAIAEGDTLVLSIRLVSELILGRYELPAPRYPDSLLARHEAGLLAEARSVFSAKMTSGHRSDAFNRLILPRCETIARSIGHRILYESALDAQLDQKIINVYEAGVLKDDPAWYVSNINSSNWEIFEAEDTAITAALPDLEKWLAMADAEKYCYAPIMTDESWRNFSKGLPCFRGAARANLGTSTATVGVSPRL